MTFCVAMKVEDGLVGIADTRVTTGSECITAKKVSSWQIENGSLFLMTSGLRAVRDKMREVQKYLDPDLTHSFAVAVVPDAVSLAGSSLVMAGAALLALSERRRR